MTYQNVELVITGKAPGGIPTYTGNNKHVVNGSFEENGDYLPGGAGSDSPPQSFSCNGALSAIEADGGGDNLSWKHHGSGLSFQAITETYGFAKPGPVP